MNTPETPTVWWSPSRGLLRQVGDELRGPRGLLDEPPADAVRLVPDTGQDTEPDDDRVSVPRVHLERWSDNIRTLSQHAIRGLNAQDAAVELAGRIQWWAETPARAAARLRREGHLAPLVGQASDGRSDEDVARAFHEAYERLAPDFGYRTREASAKPWADVPEGNRALMIATVRAIRALLGTDTEEVGQ